MSAVVSSDEDEAPSTRIDMNQVLLGTKSRTPAASSAPARARTTGAAKKGSGEKRRRRAAPAPAPASRVARAKLNETLERAEQSAQDLRSQTRRGVREVHALGMAHSLQASKVDNAMRCVRHLSVLASVFKDIHDTLADSETKANLNESFMHVVMQKLAPVKATMQSLIQGMKRQDACINRLSDLYAALARHLTQVETMHLSVELEMGDRYARERAALAVANLGAAASSDASGRDVPPMDLWYSTVSVGPSSLIGADQDARHMLDALHPAQTHPLNVISARRPILRRNPFAGTVQPAVPGAPATSTSTRKPRSSSSASRKRKTTPAASV